MEDIPGFAGRCPNAEGVPKAGGSDKVVDGKVPVGVFDAPNAPVPDPKAPGFWFVFPAPKQKPVPDVF